MATIKTTLHHYQYESGSHPEYKAMVARIEANADGRGHWMHSWGGKRDYRLGNVSESVELETAHVFGNQWNTADGRRVFDWHEEYRTDGRKYGHWLEVTPEMADVRRNTHKCGYCGHQYGPGRDPLPADGFCGRCLDSPYLKETELHLLRLRPVVDVIASVYHIDREDRAPLTEAERAALMPKYVERQTTGSDSRAVEKRAKQREKITHDYEVDSTNAKNERDGMLWLLDRGQDIENVIYYKHTGKFSFGWRSPVSPAVKSKLLDLLCEFPFDYEIK